MRYVLRASLPVLDALALEFEATSYYVQQLYNTLYRSFIATSYPVSHKLCNTLHRAVDAALCSHEFTFECDETT